MMVDLLNHRNVSALLIYYDLTVRDRFLLALLLVSRLA